MRPTGGLWYTLVPSDQSQDSSGIDKLSIRDDVHSQVNARAQALLVVSCSSEMPLSRIDMVYVVVLL